MIATLLLAAAVAQTPIDAERAFAADAKTAGQWTAFRKWATADATMFAPQPVNAQTFLKGRKDPPTAIDWWPTASYISCDSTLAVNTGGWKRSDGTVGYFTTVWQRQADGGWKWIVDSGDALTKPRSRPSKVVTQQASCRPAPKPVLAGQWPTSQVGGSRDHSLLWEWALNATKQTRVVTITVWTGAAYSDGFEDVIGVE